jgi:ATP-dependent RNA helicase DeaD
MTTFKDLGLNPMILQALEELGFEQPTPIQGKTIPHLINSDKDLIAQAQTGTGKTAAFALPVIQQLNEDDDNVQSLILCPTRELALQITKDIGNYIKYSPGIKVTPVYGGERIDKQIRALKKRPQIVVGTPGRVNDMIKRRVLKVGAIKWLILDEADEMLNMGFKEELDTILENTPENKQVLLFSATMNKPVRRIADNYMNESEEIKVGDTNKGADNVEHIYYVVHEKDRYNALKRITDMNTGIHGIIFCRTRRETQQIADKLAQDHYSAEPIHGEISQEQRTHVMNKFRDKKIQLLVATDVAARGIDVNGLTHIINYNLPESGEAYVHRSGRTGRANNKGISVIILNMREKHKVRFLERKIGRPFEQGKIPSGEDICESQLFKLVDKVSNIEVNEDQIEKYLELINKKFEDMDREELIKKFISMEFNRFLDQYKDAVDLNSGVGRERSQRNERGRGGNSSMLFARFRLNIGKSSGLNVKALLGFLTENPALRSVEIGNIEIDRDYTLFEIDQNYKDNVVDCFRDVEVGDTMVEATCEETGVRSTREPSRKPRGGGSRGGRGGGYRGGHGGGGGHRGGRSGGGGGRPGGYRGNKPSKRTGGSSGGPRGKYTRKKES